MLWKNPLHAESYFEKAVKLNPNYASAHQWYAEYLVTVGKYMEAIAQMQHALELDPLSLIINTNVGWMYYLAGRYEEAVEPYMKTIALEPTFFPAREKLGRLYLAMGNFEEAQQQLEKARVLRGGGPSPDLGYYYAVTGDTAEALRIIDELKALFQQGDAGADGVALIYAGLAYNDQAFKWLEKAYQDRAAIFPYIKADPRFKNLRSDPRFAAFLRKMGLVAD